MTERERNIELRDGLRHQGLCCDLFPDQARGVRKPYDMVACTPTGRYWAIEGKRVEIPAWDSKKAILTARMFEEDQLPSLMEVARREALASVALFVQPPQVTKTRAWLLSARWVVTRLRDGEALRLTDLQGRVELVRLMNVGWGVTPTVLEVLPIVSNGFLWG